MVKRHTVFHGKVNKYMLASIICLFICCFPRNREAYKQFCTVLRILDIPCVSWSVYILIKIRIYKNKWLYPMWAILFLMILCTIIENPSDVENVSVTVYRMFVSTVLSDYMLRKNARIGIKWIALIWWSFMIIEGFSLITNCFGKAYSVNGRYGNNYFFGNRVELNEYIIYTLAFCGFAMYSKALNAFYFASVATIGIYFVLKENLSTSIVGLAVFFLILIIARIIKSEKIWRNLLLFLLLLIGIFIALRQTKAFEWLLTGTLGEDLTLSGRTRLWEQAIEQMKGTHLIFGYGFSPPYNFRLNVSVFNHPHNQYLQMLYNFGVGGLLLYLIVIYQMIKQIKYLPNSKNKPMYIASLVATLIMCITSRNFFYTTAQIFYVIAFHLKNMCKMEKSQMLSKRKT